MRTLKVIAIMVLFLSGEPFAHSQEQDSSRKLEIGTYTIKVNNTRVRLEPSYQGKITNTLSKGTKVYVYEFKSGWARVSKEYPGSVEGVIGDQLTGLVARWVPVRLLQEARK